MHGLSCLTEGICLSLSIVICRYCRQFCRQLRRRKSLIASIALAASFALNLSDEVSDDLNVVAGFFKMGHMSTMLEDSDLRFRKQTMIPTCSIRCCFIISATGKKGWNVDFA